eukprot:scaffold544_cov320-Pavlova_lutheri.AAC.77
MGWLRRSKSGRGTSQPSSPGDGSARLSVVYGDDSRFDEEEGEFDVYYDACEVRQRRCNGRIGGRHERRRWWCEETEGRLTEGIRRTDVRAQAQLHPWASENGGLSCPPDILAQQRKCVERTKKKHRSEQNRSIEETR